MRSTRGRWGGPSRVRSWSGRGFGRSSRRGAGRRSGFTPADAFLGVLEEDALGRELFADGVRPREVAPGAGRLPLGDEPLDFRFKFDLSSSEDIQVAVRVIEEGSHRRFGYGTRLAPVDRRIAFADGVEQEPYALREVEVVVEGGAVGGPSPLQRGDERGIVGSGRLEAVDALGEVTQPAHLLAGGADRVLVHPELAPVVRAGHQEKADRDRVVAGVEEVAEGGYVAEPLRHLGARRV